MWGELASLIVLVDVLPMFALGVCFCVFLWWWCWWFCVCECDCVKVWQEVGLLCGVIVCCGVAVGMFRGVAVVCVMCL